MKPLTLCMQEGSLSDITTHISATNPKNLGFRTRPATDDITGNGSQLQTVHRRIFFTGKSRLNLKLTVAHKQKKTVIKVAK